MGNVVSTGADFFGGRAQMRGFAAARVCDAGGAASGRRSRRPPLHLVGSIRPARQWSRARSPPCLRPPIIARQIAPAHPCRPPPPGHRPLFPLFSLEALQIFSPTVPASPDLLHALYSRFSSIPHLHPPPPSHLRPLTYLVHPP